MLPLYSSVSLLKIIASAMLLSTSMWLYEIFTKYVFADWQFLIFVSVMVALDTLLGTWLSVKGKGFDPKILFTRLIEKMVLYMTLLIMAHVLSSFTIQGNPNDIYRWFVIALYSIIMGKESWSILTNINKLDPNGVANALKQIFVNHFNKKQS